MDAHNGVVDVTGEAVKIDYQANIRSLRRYGSGIPYWEARYIYSYNELQTATAQQDAFYQYFKKQFQVKDYLDLEGNYNYAFILLFDLLENYKLHTNTRLLEQSIFELAANYPKTKAYALSALSLVLEEQQDWAAIDRIRDFQLHLSTDRSLKLGNRFRKKLMLNDYDVELLNKIWYPDNSFCEIEFCLRETVKLFLLVTEAIDRKYLKEGATTEVEFNTLADLITHKQLGTGINNYNYKYTMLSAIGDIYTFLFKNVENAVRQAYGHARKLNTDVNYNDEEIDALYKEKVVDKLGGILPVWISRIEAPDEQANIKLNALNTTRWRSAFQSICEKHAGNAPAFYQAVLELARLNSQNPSVEMIYFEASKSIAKADKLTALDLFVNYVFTDMQSAVFDNRQMNKTVQKSLFATDEQFNDFRDIINKLIASKDLQAALTTVRTIYLPKRKKMILNQEAISQINERHAGTVELLNKYLADEEPEPPMPVPVTASTAPHQADIVLPLQSNTLQTSIYEASLGLSATQVAVLNMFKKSNFTLAAAEVDAFAKANSVFKNHLTDSINEICYELLDDVLIEEDEEHYIINQQYYNNILAK
ncbi:hypothetical protein BC343_17205 [Mucilaginibacter pedocola]|uniref:TerB-C domain-containing protein n=1 Tax=Mucilaginibacter pedocola TaxID=1792845 RepID=A0A1S9P7J8_9SPHI|nr:hypothetical protein BC343_17205 [Mucilaginibacter pedocola]